MPNRIERRHVPARLIEATPESFALGHWLLASPMLVFGGWLWTDLFRLLMPMPWSWLELVLGIDLYALGLVVPLGYAAHRIVTSLPQPFQHSGWDVMPLEPVSAGELYMVRYTYAERVRAQTTWSRVWLRAAQGWVYLEIFAIFAGAIAMVPIFYSVTQFGFGQ